MRFLIVVVIFAVLGIGSMGKNNIGNFNCGYITKLQLPPTLQNRPIQEIEGNLVKIG